MNASALRHSGVRCSANRMARVRVNVPKGPKGVHAPRPVVNLRVPRMQAVSTGRPGLAISNLNDLEVVDGECLPQWDFVLEPRDFDAEMEGLPVGIQYAKARDHGACSATTDAYNKEMAARMGSQIAYKHDWGMNYSWVLPKLIVGSVPQDAEDIDYLADHCGVTAILNLQQPQDWENFGIDFHGNHHRAESRGDIKIIRHPIQDFDSASLRECLPAAVAQLSSLLDAGETVYVHCTAGLGRAPGVAITAMHWLYDMKLEEAYSWVTSRRACHPRAAAIREATMDMSMGEGGLVSFHWDGHGHTNDVQVTGSFNEWKSPGVPLQGFADGFFMKELCLPPGLHQYKFIVDGDWVHTPDRPSVNLDGGTNNIVLVRPPNYQLLSSMDQMAEANI